MKISDDILEKIESKKNLIGELLLEHTSLTDNQLKEALEIQNKKKTSWVKFSFEKIISILMK
jgi:hypothetical protein